VVPGGDPVELLYACHHTTFGINFESRRDDYLAAVFRSSADRSMRVEPQVGEYGVRPVSLSVRSPGIWQVNFKLPPGLTPGWHDVTMRVEGVTSNATRIAVDMPLAESKIRIAGVSDGTTWARGVLERAHGSTLAAWIEGLPENADRANVRVRLGGDPVEVLYVSAADGQVNVNVPAEAPAGFYRLEAQVGGSRSEPFPVEIAG
jgi:hypothetical protein